MKPAAQLTAAQLIEILQRVPGNTLVCIGEQDSATEVCHLPCTGGRPPGVDMVYISEAPEETEDEAFERRQTARGNGWTFLYPARAA